MANKLIQYTEEMVGESHPTKADTLNRALVVEHNNDGTHKMTDGAAGDIFYHDATQLVRLALGAANLKLFINAAGDGLEYASGMKSTNHTYDLATASGNQTLSGVGFTPSAAIVLAALSTISGYIGVKSTTQFGLITMYNSVVLAVLGIQFINASVTTGNNAICSITFNSDGGVLAWTKTGSPTGTLEFSVLWLR